MDQPKVSVVIPVYNASAYIDRCCRSLFAQTLVQMEYIFVSDGSKDDSIQIIQQTLEEFPKRKYQVKIIDRKINKGVSYTRQEGVDNATGEFVIHCDSDDWVDVDMYEKLYTVANQQQADIVCCGYQTISEVGVLTVSKFEDLDFFKSLQFNIGPLTGSLVNKLVRRDLLIKNQIKFPENIGWGEDFCVALSCLLLSSKTVCISDCPYHYWQNETSITHTLSKGKVRELIEVADYVQSFLYKNKLMNQYDFQLNYLKFQVKAPFLMFKEIRDLREWRIVYPESNIHIGNYPGPIYLRIAAKLTVRRLYLLADIVLRARDIVSSIIRK